MKNKILLSIMSFLIGGLVFGSIGIVMATVYNASNITYSPTDNTWNVNNVQSAIDDLYFNSQKDLTFLGLNSLGTQVDETINNNRASYNVPAGIKTAYLIYSPASNDQFPVCNITGSIITSQEKLGIAWNKDIYYYQDHSGLIIYKLELSGESGTVSININDVGSGYYRAWTSALVYQ